MLTLLLALGRQALGGPYALAIMGTLGAVGVVLVGAVYLPLHDTRLAHAAAQACDGRIARAELAQEQARRQAAEQAAADATREAGLRAAAAALASAKVDRLETEQGALRAKAEAWDAARGGGGVGFRSDDPWLRARAGAAAGQPRAAGR